ncbi:hypothetical protein ACHAXR_002778 [Thalassiosira sp. AJA248-18]
MHPGSALAKSGNIIPFGRHLQRLQHHSTAGHRTATEPTARDPIVASDTMRWSLLTMLSFLSRSTLARKGPLPMALLRPNDAAFSFQTQSTRSKCSGGTTSASIFSPAFHLPAIESLHQRGHSHRLFSTTEKTTTPVSLTRNDRDHLLDPYEILRNLPSNKNQHNQDMPKIPLPTHLSPTSLETFHKCPQAFFFLYILKLTQDPPVTPQLARGIICHTALEEVFDLSPENRSLVNLENLFRREWGRLRGNREGNALKITDGDKRKTKKEEGYDVLFREEKGDDPTNPGYDIAAEIDWGKSALDLLKNYYELEDPREVRNPNPLTREMWVQSRFPLGNSNDENEESFVVRGKIDRIDILPSSSGKVQLQIIDYKTGKKPNFKYSPSVNERIANEQFWKMKVYALILWKMIHQTDKTSEQSRIHYGEEQGKQKDQYKYGLSWTLQQRLLQACTQVQTNDPTWSNILELNSLRLMYLTSHLDDASANNESTDSRSIGRANHLDYPLGASPSEFQSILDQTEHEVQDIAKDIKRLVDMQSPHAFEHCDWRYCSCHELRRKFVRGSVFQSPDLDF